MDDEKKQFKHIIYTYNIFNTSIQIITCVK